jgi:hypothetical protein
MAVKIDGPYGDRDLPPRLYDKERRQFVKSKWLSRILLLSAGIVLGLIGGMMLTSKASQTAMNLSSLSYRAWEANQSMNAYLSDKPEIARYALNHYADILRSFYENKDKDGFPEATAQDLAFTYIRLGKIEINRKRSSDAELFYNRGYAIYKQYCIDSAKEVPSREKLIDLITKIDAQTKTKSISLSDTVAGKPHEVSK